MDSGTWSTSAAIWAKLVFVPVMSAEPTMTLIVPSPFRTTMPLAGWRPPRQPPGAEATSAVRLLLRRGAFPPDRAVADRLQALPQPDSRIGLAAGQRVALLHGVLEPHLQRVQAKLLRHHVHMALHGAGGVVRRPRAQRADAHLVREHLEPLDLQVRALVVPADEQTAGQHRRAREGARVVYRPALERRERAVLLHPRLQLYDRLRRRRGGQHVL